MPRPHSDSFKTRSRLSVGGRTVDYFSLATLAKAQGGAIDRLPFSIRILLENLLRSEDGRLVRGADVEALAKWNASAPQTGEVPYMPARVLLQDFTGVPAVVDLAAMRDAMRRLRGRPPPPPPPHPPPPLLL